MDIKLYPEIQRLVTKTNCRFGVSPVNYPDPDPENCVLAQAKTNNEDLLTCIQINSGLNRSVYWLFCDFSVCV